MTVILPDDYHARSALVKRGVQCMPKDAALHQDIRALRIGILNIMPKADTYEFNLLFPLGRSILQIHPIWIRLESHEYKSTDKDHLDDLYIPFKDAIAEKHLDGLIVTGAPVEEVEFKDVTYWDEITRILNYAQKNIPSTLGICWGGLALAKHIGIDKVKYSKKLFGVFETNNLIKGHPITGDLDDRFWCPQSRFAGIPDEVLEAEKEKGRVSLLAHSKETGYTIFETPDHKFVMHLGHPEYNRGRIIDEANRDKLKGREDVEPPVNFDMDKPLNLWRSHRNEFFRAWIKYVYLTTEF
ncbi:MAG: homoserine O-succinyltransferase [Calditrichaceae bacterium]|nr:homoserine O-succinyltransferase [Calditrichaceae bacterium]